MSIDQIMTDDYNKIKVFGSDDDLKSLGELLSNETSRKIIKNLMEHEMYTNEIATKLNMRVSLVIHHLKKMEALGLLEITDKKIKRKGEKHRFFKMDSDIFVAFNKTKEEVKKKGILKIFFKEGIKFTVLGVSSLLAFFFTGGIGASEFGDSDLPSLREISPITYSMIVFSIVLLFFYFKKHIRKR